MKNRNLIPTPDRSTLYPGIISSILDFSKKNEIEVSDDLSRKLENFNNEYSNYYFSDLVTAISNQDKFFDAFTILIKMDSTLILNIIKKDPIIRHDILKPTSHLGKMTGSDQPDLNEKNSDNTFELKPVVRYDQALTLSLALAQAYLKKTAQSKDEKQQIVTDIKAIMQSIVHIIQDNPEWKDSNVKKALFVEAVEFIISKMNDNQLIAKLVNWVSPNAQKDPSRTFQFLHEQTGLVSRTFTASYVKIVDCAKNKMIENAKLQTKAPDSNEEIAVKSILKIETGLGKHAPNFFNHQPKHLEQYEKIISEKQSIHSNKPEH